MLAYHLFARKLKRVARTASITENVHPHRLRHTYATELLRSGVSLIGVMKLLGHKTLRMTLRYVEVTDEDLGREYLIAIEQTRHRYSELKDVPHAKTDREILSVFSQFSRDTPGEISAYTYVFTQTPAVLAVILVPVRERSPRR